MGTRRKILAGLALAIAFLSPVVALSPANASESELPITKEIVDELVHGYGNSIVVIEPAELSNRDLLEEASFYSYASVVAVDSKALGSYDPQDLSRFIVHEDANDVETGFNLLVVNKSGKDEIYVSAINEDLEKTLVDIFGGRDENGIIYADDPGWEILRHAEQISAAQEEYRPDMGVVGLILLAVFGGAGLLVLIIAGIVWLVRRHEESYFTRKEKKRLRLRKKEEKKAAKLREQNAKKEAAEQAKRAKEREAHAAEVTPKIESQLKTLSRSADSLKVEDKQLSDGIKLVLERFVELREAINLMETPTAKREILYLEYEDRLSKLITLVGPKYYLDIKKNPEHWREPQEKIDAIRLSFEKTAEQILENIIQLKEGSEFDFEIAIDAILGFKVLDPKDMLS